MEDQLGFDTETGEVHRTISEAAIAAAAPPNAAFLAGVNAELNHAIFEAVKQMPLWIKAESQGARGKYAKLPAILTVVRPLLFEQGIRIRQGASRSWTFDEGGGTKGRLVPVYTDLIHTPTGQFERTEMEVPLPKMDPMGMGSSITYGKRWTLLAGLGLATDEADDDGEAAKLKDLHDTSPDSAELIALKAGMDKIKDASKLTEWVSEGQQKKRFSALSEPELERARAYYSERGKAILAEPEREPARGGIGKQKNNVDIVGKRGSDE